MKRLVALILASMMLLTACSSGGQNGSGQESSGNPSQDAVERKDYNIAYSAELASINYMKSSLSSVTQFTYGIVDGLVDFDKYGVLQPCLATDWTISEDGLTYTFHLRKGVKWYTCDGEEYGEVTANDFLTSAQWIMTQENASTTSNILYSVIKNGKAYYDGEITDFSQVGIRAVDDYTLEYTLERPTPYFLKMVAYVCFLPVNGDFLAEVGEMFGTSNDTLLYNGAYIMSTWEPESRRILELNENYWDKENIFISSINYTYNKEAKTLGPELFLRGEIDQTLLPAEIIDEWMNDPEKSQMVQKRPVTTTSNFIGFNFEPLYEEEYGPENWKVAVNNLSFRKALFHGIDREAAVMAREPYDPKSRLTNTITAANWTSVDGVDYTQLPALKEISNTDTFNKELALEYKEKAMEELAGKVTFPVQAVMPYNTNSLEMTNSVQIMEQQVENLLGKDFIDIVLVPYPPTDFNKAARSSGKFSMMEMGWGPDYIDPMAYTEVMVSDTSIGTKYSRPYMAEDLKDADGNSIYETMVFAAREEVLDLSKRYQLFSEAEAYLIDNALVLPFYISLSLTTCLLYVLSVTG